MTNSKQCLACERPIIGRADKKFCNDNCRNSYNNLLNSDTVNHVRNINNILRKNRRILEEALRVANKTVVMPKTDLIKKGFSFRFYTSSYTNPASQTYFFCYEYGYRLFENDKSKELYLLVRNTLKEFAQETKEEVEDKRL